MIKTLVKYIGKYKKHSLIAPVFVTLEALMEIIIPFLTSNLIDYGIDKGDMQYITKMGLCILICAVLSIVFGCIAGRNTAIASVGFAKNLREEMYRKIQKFSFSNIDKYSCASIITRLTTDTAHVQEAYETLIFAAPLVPAILIFSLIFSFRINVKLSLIFLACVPVLSLVLYLIVKKAHPLFKKVFKTYDNLNEVVGENLDAIRVVKSFNREEYEKNKFFKISNKIYKYFFRAERVIAFNMPAMQISIYACMILASWFGARIIVNCRNNPENGLSTGQLLSLISYSAQILISLMILSMVLTTITISFSSAQRISEILNEKSDLQSPENSVKSIKNGDISFKNVGFSYTKDKENLCLKNINLDIKSGEFIGITGGTGTGKSTLVHLIPRLYDASVGSVSVAGIDVKKYDLKSLRNSVAMVLQKNTLFSGTIKENLRWGNENASDSELEKVCKISQADEFIKNMPDKYDTYIEQGGTNVSGGQKQRLCIARALLKNPKILILDNATSAVDTKTDSMIRKALEQYLPQATKIVISQRILSIENADRIIFMENGRIVDFDTHDNLLKNCDLYRETFELQQKGGNLSESR